MDLRFGYGIPLNVSNEKNYLNQSEDSEKEHVSSKSIITFKDKLGLHEPVLYDFALPKQHTLKKKPIKEAKDKVKKESIKKCSNVKKEEKKEWNGDLIVPGYFDSSTKKVNTSNTNSLVKSNCKIELDRRSGKIVGRIHTSGIAKSIEMYYNPTQLYIDESQSKHPKNFLRKRENKINKRRTKDKEVKENMRQEIVTEEEEEESVEKEKMREEFNNYNKQIENLKDQFYNEKIIRAQMDKAYKSKIDTIIDFLKSAVHKQTIKAPTIQPIKNTQPPNPKMKKVEKMEKIEKSIRKSPKKSPKKSPRRERMKYVKESSEEMGRQAQLNMKTIEAIDRLYEHPLADYYEMPGNFELKMKVVMKRMSIKAQEMERLEKIKNKRNTFKGISTREMSNWIDEAIEYYIDDMLKELTLEMNTIESQKTKNLLSEEEEELMMELLEKASTLDKEQAILENKWLEENTTPESYKNPFEEEDTLIYKRTITQLNLSQQIVIRIRDYTQNYKKYKCGLEGSINPDIWKVYDNITEDILSQLLTQSVEGFVEKAEQYVDKLINNEFIS